MKQYQEGDIIYKDGKTYRCEMASEAKAIFRHVIFGAVETSADGCCDSLGSSQWAGNNFILLEEARFPSSIIDSTTGARKNLTSTDYAVIGSYGGTCKPVLWNLSALSSFPELCGHLSKKLASVSERVSVIPLVKPGSTSAVKGITMSTVKGKKPAAKKASKKKVSKR